MRVIQTVNDTIRLLFNPKNESFTLGDFLLVRDINENFLGQIVEVYDDKFDQESNVAKIRLVYRIVNGNEIVPYNNYTPSRECEVAKIRQSEIEKCINLNKPVVEVGCGFKSKETTKINSDFFENNCVIFADKFEQTNQIIENIAPKLTGLKNVLILDFSGSVSLEGISPYTASSDFKIPLSSGTIDYIRQKVLLRAKLETQAVLGSVFEEVKNYLEETEDDYISYTRFMQVIQQQYKLSPAVELLVLISWLKKYARMGIYARNKKDFENVLKSIEKEKTTLIDLSGLKIEWQKEYLEYLINAVENDIFLFIRLNDNNINNDILNQIYLKKKNISFIPSFAYGFKKASYVMDFARNYILTPTLNPKRDFTNANFQLQSLNKDSYMLFGDDTKDLIFVLQNEAIYKGRKSNSKSQKTYISLNLQLEDMPPLELKSENFEILPQSAKKKQVQEEIMLSDVLQSLQETPDVEADEVDEEQENYPKEQADTVSQEDNIQEIEEENIEEQKEEVLDEVNEPEETISEQDIQDTVEEAPEVEENQDFEEESAPEDILGEDELDYFEQAEEIKEENQEEASGDTKEEIKEQIEEIKEQKVNDNEEITIEENLEEEIKSSVEAEEIAVVIEKEAEKEISENEVLKENPKTKRKKKETKTSENQTEEETIKEGFPKIKEQNENIEEEIVENQEVQNVKEDFPKIKKERKTAKKSKKSENELLEFAESQKTEEDTSAIENNEENQTVIDELIETKKAQIEAENQEKQALQEKEDEEINRKFEEIMLEPEENKSKDGMLQINDNVAIDLKKIKKDVKSPEHKLPIFNDDDDASDDSEDLNFNENDIVSHEKYGKGKVLKVLKYNDRCLLQIEFPEIGKRLLDPKIAKLDLVQEV